MKKKLEFSWKRIWQRSLTLVVMIATLTIIIRTGSNFLAIVIWSSTMAGIIFSWLISSRNEKRLSIAPLIAYVMFLLVFPAIILLRFIGIDYDLLETLDLAYLMTILAFIIYHLILIREEVREEIKDWLGAKLGYPFLIMFIAQIVIIGLMLIMPFSNKKKLES